LCRSPLQLSLAHLLKARRFPLHPSQHNAHQKEGASGDGVPDVASRLDSGRSTRSHLHPDHSIRFHFPSRSLQVQFVLILLPSSRFEGPEVSSMPAKSTLPRGLRRRSLPTS
jgi:hypothetical protein